MRRSPNSLLLAAATLLAGCSGGGTGAAPQPPAPRHYVALGDSYSAGGGLPAGVRPCGRAPGAYPALVAQRAGLVAEIHTCNGATTADVLEIEQAPGVGRQIDAVTAE